jgi:hypothetical protein
VRRRSPVNSRFFPSPFLFRVLVAGSGRNKTAVQRLLLDAVVAFRSGPEFGPPPAGREALDRARGRGRDENEKQSGDFQWCSVSCVRS